MKPAGRKAQQYFFSKISWKETKLEKSVAIDFLRSLVVPSSYRVRHVLTGHRGSFYKPKAQKENAKCQQPETFNSQTMPALYQVKWSECSWLEIVYSLNQSKYARSAMVHGDTFTLWAQHSSEKNVRLQSVLLLEIIFISKLLELERLFLIGLIVLRPVFTKRPPFHYVLYLTIIFRKVRLNLKFLKIPLLVLYQSLPYAKVAVLSDCKERQTLERKKILIQFC